MKRALISVAVLSVLVGLPSAAQNSISSGAIVGRVRDPSGAFVRGAVVTAIDNETQYSSIAPPTLLGSTASP
jgi:hypothetical protein